MIYSQQTVAYGVLRSYTVTIEAGDSSWGLA